MSKPKTFQQVRARFLTFRPHLQGRTREVFYTCLLTVNAKTWSTFTSPLTMAKAMLWEEQNAELPGKGTRRFERQLRKLEAEGVIRFERRAFGTDGRGGSRRFMDLWWEGQYEKKHEKKWAEPVYDSDDLDPSDPVLPYKFAEPSVEALTARGVNADDAEAVLAAAGFGQDDCIDADIIWQRARDTMALPGAYEKKLDVLVENLKWLRSHPEGWKAEVAAKAANQEARRRTEEQERSWATLTEDARAKIRALEAHREELCKQPKASR